MKTIILCIFAIYVNTVFAETKTDQQIIDEYVKIEYQEIIQNIAEIKKEPGTVFAEGDLAFYGRWKAGLEKEKKRKYKEAVSEYLSALNESRYEMSTYYVLLPLGRVLMLSNNKHEAKKKLEEYIKKAESELTGKSGNEWILSEEGEKKIKRDIEFAKFLLKRTGK